MAPAAIAAIGGLLIKLLDFFKPEHRKGQPVIVGSNSIVADKLGEHTTHLGLAEATAFFALLLPELGYAETWAQPCGALLLLLLSVYNIHRADPARRAS